ncbi:hypothetical protein Heshes_07220 [Alicyclobacillus hesperidum]|uniref:Predicted oxidoreductase, contains short-chain dehydrogenase (SDR) and DUF2520 domains n=2 Tax=Alicyclobacillus hesperidum TaxID=89784 RepID=A0A1H2WXD3_9BACL|nr:hypothetical protein Heshes_07220 [Alicyclobacillus hesperidum]SDW84924.1 Predicted oxidoreductase, contains short-chain dehydrogenase (SDR) and DUF2520 domains [Alicyclobacillus hesperidum]
MVADQMSEQGVERELADHDERNPISLRMVIVGPGRVGTAVACACRDMGAHVECALEKDTGSKRASEFERMTGVPVMSWHTAVQMVRRADVVWLTVPDRAIANVAMRLCELDMLRPGQMVIHTSGALTSHALSAAANCGAYVGSVHPLQAFADVALGARALSDIAIAVEGHPEVVRLAFMWAQRWGCHPFALSAADKAAYHAAAVLASNALVALLGTAARLAPLPDGVRSLLPLVRGTIDNVERLGIPQALTGPIERGDTATVVKHLDALADDSAARDVYLALARATVPIALAKGSIGMNQVDELERWLGSETGGE